MSELDMIQLSRLRRLSLSEVCGQAKRVGFNLPDWLASCMTGLSGITIPHVLWFEVLVTKKIDVWPDAFCRFSARGTGMSIQAVLRTHPRLKEDKLIPFVSTRCGGYLLASCTGLDKQKQLLYYDAKGANRVNTRGKGEVSVGNEFIHKVNNSKVLVKSLGILSSNVASRK